LYKEKVRERRKGVVNYTFEVVVFGQNGSKSQKTITLGESLYMKDMNITIDKQNMVRIIGFYGEKSKDDVAKGVFSMTFDKDMNISKKSQKPFSTEFIQSFNKVKKKNADALDKFDIKEIINNNDGTVVVLAERSYIVTRTTRDSRGNTHTTYVYYDQDILWIKLTETFEVGQIKQIAKNQIGNSSILHSFVSYHKGDGVIYLLFNDHVENTEISGNEDKIMREGKAALFSVKIDNDGKMTKKLLYERHPDKFFLLPRFSSQVNDKEVLLFTMRGKEYLFGRAIF
jgi:hypothetical protein